MDDETHVRLIDAHAKRDGGTDDRYLVIAPPPLNLLSLVVRQTGVIVPHNQALFTHLTVPTPVFQQGLAQLVGELLAFSPAQTVDDARHHVPKLVDVMGLDHAFHLLHHCLGFFGPDLVTEVGTVEAATKSHTLLKAQLQHHVLLDPGSGGGRQGHDGHIVEVGLEDPKALVVRPEVVPPLAHAVRFVDHDPGEVVILIEALEGRLEGVALDHLFWGDVQQLDGRMRRTKVIHDAPLLHVIHARAQIRARNVDDPQLRYLVFDEGDQGRNYHGHAPAERRKLEAQAFASSGRHEDEAVPSAHGGVDCFQLVDAEAVVSKVALVVPHDLLRPIKVLPFPEPIGGSFCPMAAHRSDIDRLQLGPLVQEGMDPHVHGGQSGQTGKSTIHGWRVHLSGFHVHDRRRETVRISHPRNGLVSIVRRSRVASLQWFHSIQGR
mmetsp:Transcript_1507/g.9263  ORF Transcript_1507/g.9263 Transcript_1507/m.9263 type:complete len:435 (+) Transcript_1507:2248-3552(+)